jgi:uncharacterized protein (TIGR00297 family)
MIVRNLLGVLLAVAIAMIARRARSLTTSGAMAAAVAGSVAVAVGWSWGITLILYFASSTLLSRLGRVEKERRTRAVVAKGGERDAWQVLANGGVFLVAAIGALLHPQMNWIAIGAGALAASAADTWATEIGTLYGGPPRSILTGRVVETGRSGGITLAGTLASISGAAFIALVVVVTGAAGQSVAAWHSARAILLGGIVGAFADSLIGATMQSRRWCDDCRCETERDVHHCGASTVPRRGIRWLDNDAVNFVSTIVGGLLAAFLAR